MPYSVDSPNLPSHVQGLSHEQRSKWVDTFNGVLSNCNGEDCEGQAFAIANAEISKSLTSEREHSLKHVAMPIKSLGERRIGGYGVVFTDPDSPDLEGDYFDKNESFFWDDLPTVYLLYDHTEGFHPEGMEVDDSGKAYAKSMPPQDYIIGRVVERKRTDYGLWFEAVLNEHDEWCDHIMRLAEKGVLGFSTDSISHTVQRERKGNANLIKSWAIPFLSLTPIPAEVRTQVKVIENATGRDAPEVELPQVTYPELIKRIKNGKSVDRKVTPTMKVNTSQLVEAYFRRNIKHVLTPALKNAFYKLVEEDVNEEKQFSEGEDQPIQDANKMGEFGNGIQPHAMALSTKFGMPEEEAFNALVQIVSAYLQNQIMDTAVADVPVPTSEEGTEVELEVEPTSEAESEEILPGEEEAYASLDNEYDDTMALDDEELGSATLNIKSITTPKGSTTLNTPALSVKATSFRARRQREPETLTRFLRAFRDKDYPYLKSAHLRAIEGDPNSDFEFNQKGYKALGINPDTAGGFLVPPETSNQIIELLRAKSKIMDLVTVVPMNKSDILDIPKQTGGATSYFVGENAQITESQETFGMVRLVVRKQAALVKISNELLSDSSADVDAFIRDDISKSMANKFDQTVLIGTGTAAEPLGLLNSLATSTPASNPTSYSDLLSVVERVEVENVDDTVEWFWVLHPTAKRVLRLMKDPNNQYIWTGSDGIGQQVAGTEPDQLLGYPWIQTTLGDVDVSGYPRIFFGNWKDVVVGMRKTIEIRASDEAGTAFEYDQTWIRAIMRWDVALRHSESIEVLTGVRSA